MRTPPRALLASAALVGLVACTKADDVVEEPLVPHLEMASATLVPDDDGVAVVEVVVPEDGASMLITALWSGAGNVRASRIVNPAGTRVYDANAWLVSDPYRFLTMANRSINDQVVVNWPIRPDDAPLIPGTWTVELEVIGDGAPSGQLEVTTQVRVDDDIETGALHATIVYSNGLDQESDAVEAVEAAAAVWARIFADAGVELEVRYAADDDLPQIASDPNAGGEDILQASESGQDDDITVVVSRAMEVDNSVLGITGAIPAALVATPHAALVISINRLSGPDREFDEDEIEMFGEVMAHEAGHYVGLFHPVETTWTYWDALGDTDECSSQRSCEGDLGDNLMFPYPVCTGWTWDTCTPQQALSDDQAGVVRRYTGVY